jgi:hypothetical protein
MVLSLKEEERQRGREAERQRGREAERQRGREAERQRGREAERQRGREAERQGSWHNSVHQHVGRWHAGEESLNLRVTPELRVVREQPALHNPDGIWVCRFQSTVHCGRDGLQVGWIVRRRVHLVE